VPQAPIAVVVPSTNPKIIQGQQPVVNSDPIELTAPIQSVNRQSVLGPTPSIQSPPDIAQNFSSGDSVAGVKRNDMTTPVISVAAENSESIQKFPVPQGPQLDSGRKSDAAKGLAH
jgi:hypothetical protein